jgi:hypothetical protein
MARRADLFSQCPWETLTCSGVIWILVWVAGEGLLPVCFLHLEESEDVVIHLTPGTYRKTLLKQ